MDGPEGGEPADGDRCGVCASVVVRGSGERGRQETPPLPGPGGRVSAALPWHAKTLRLRERHVCPRETAMSVRIVKIAKAAVAIIRRGRVGRSSGRSVGRKAKGAGPWRLGPFTSNSHVVLSVCSDSVFLFFCFLVWFCFVSFSFLQLCRWRRLSVCAVKDGVFKAVRAGR